MKNQEAFDIMAVHLMEQGERSYGAGDMCLYRGPNGLKCAVGALIPDDEYKPDFEDGLHVLGDIVAECPSLSGIQHGLLFDLQCIHDKKEPEEWISCLYGAAQKHNLSSAVLDKYRDAK